MPSRYLNIYILDVLEWNGITHPFRIKQIHINQINYTVHLVGLNISPAVRELILLGAAGRKLVVGQNTAHVLDFVSTERMSHT